MTEVPLPLCACGCGEPVAIAKRTVRERGVKAGEPLRHARGHHLRLRSHTLTPGGLSCVEWNGAKNKYGSGIVNRGGVKTAARWYYEQAHGPVPPGLIVVQTCGNRACVHVYHLRAVTRKEAAALRRAR